MRVLANALALAIALVVVLAAVGALSIAAAIALPNLFQASPAVGAFSIDGGPLEYFGQPISVSGSALAPGSWASIGIFLTLFVASAFLCCLVLVAGLLVFGRRARRRDRNTVDGGRVMQELYRRSTLMRERLESLETILLARSDSASGALRGRHASKRN